MWTEIKATYAGSAKVALMAPLIFLLPAAAELAQHVAEIRSGMFESLAAMEGAANDSARLGFGVIKILTLILLIYWVNRAMARLDGAQLRLLGDARSARLFAGVLAYAVVMSLVNLFGGGFIAPYLPDQRTLLYIGIAFFLAATALEIWLSVWKAGAALGNEALGIGASFTVMRGNVWWSVGFFVLMFLPLMVVHYGMNFLAVGRSETMVWALMIADCLVVGYLGIVLAATVYMIARRATRRKDVPLIAG
jgi:hypothetical protein